MTAYAVSLEAGSPGPLIGVTPGTLQVRVVRIEANTVQGTSTTGTFKVSKYTGASITGTTMTPTKMRDGASSAGFTAKSGGTVSGTAAVLHEESYITGAGSGANSQASYTVPFDFILSPGSALWVAVFANGTSFIEVFLEELHLARST